MVQLLTKLSISDNSGARLAKCIRVLTPVSYYSFIQGKPGSVLIVNIRRIIANKRKIKKGSIYKALLVRGTIIVKRVVGFLAFNENSIILLKKTGDPFGTRIHGILSYDVRFFKNTRILSLSEGVL